MESKRKWNEHTHTHDRKHKYSYIHSLFPRPTCTYTAKDGGTSVGINQDLTSLLVNTINGEWMNEWIDWMWRSQKHIITLPSLHSSINKFVLYPQVKVLLLLFQKQFQFRCLCFILSEFNSLLNGDEGITKRSWHFQLRWYNDWKPVSKKRNCAKQIHKSKRCIQKGNKQTISGNRNRKKASLEDTSIEKKKYGKHWKKTEYRREREKME